MKAVVSVAVALVVLVVAGAVGWRYLGPSEGASGGTGFAVATLVEFVRSRAVSAPAASAS